MKKSIVYVGPLTFGGTCRQRMEAFRSLGYSVVGIDTLKMSMWRHFLFRVYRRLARPEDFAKINATILEEIIKVNPCMLWVDKGLVIHAKTLEKAKSLRPNLVRVSYSPDDMLNPDNQTNYYLKSVPLYDLHVTTKSYNVGELKWLGAKEVLFVGNAYSPEAHRPIQLNESERGFWGGQVGFVGSFEKERAESILYLARKSIRIKVWGNWPRSWVQRLSDAGVDITGRSLVGDEYAKAISAFDINLNFLRKVNRDLQTTRSIEIPACGGFMLAERTLEHLDLFKEGEEADYFSSDEELAEKIVFYVEHPERRKRIALAGKQLCLTRGYRNQDRLQTVLSFIEKSYSHQHS